MNPNPRRRLGWKILSGVLLGVIAAVGGMAVRVQLVATSAEAEWTRRLRELEAEFGPGDHRRRAGRGAPLPGNAWDDYLGAVADLQKLPQSELKTRVLRQVAPGLEDWDALLEFEEKYPEILGRAWKGTRRDVCRHPEYDRNRIGTHARFPEIRLHPIPLLASARGRLLLSRAQVRDAAAHWLDLAVFGQDLCGNPAGMGWWTGFDVFERALAGVKELIASPVVRPEGLVELSRGLALLEETYPSEGRTLRAYQFYRGSLLPEEELLLGSDCVKHTPGIQDTWRFGLSEKLMLFRGLQEMDRWTERCRAIDEMPFADVKALHAAMVDARATGNPVVATFCPDLLSWTNAWRVPRAHLRLLRAAAHYRATGEVPELADPFGARLGQSRTGSTLRLWSVGRDGEDHRGQGEWTDAPGRDIVLEVAR